PTALLPCVCAANVSTSSFTQRSRPAAVRRRLGGMAGGVSFGGNKADRREPFRQREPRRPCRRTTTWQVPTQSFDTPPAIPKSDNRSDLDLKLDNQPSRRLNLATV